MSKKTKTVVGILIIITVIAGIFSAYFFLSSNKETGISLPSLPFKEKASGDLLYEDSAGFSFKYPKSIVVEDVTPDDASYYTLLTLSKGEEQIKITAKDTSFGSVEAWVKSKEAPVGLSLYGATSLGGREAKQYSLDSKLITIAVDQGVLYLIEGPKDGGFWEETQSVFLSTFAFAGSTPSGGTSDTTIYEEEEVVE